MNETQRMLFAASHASDSMTMINTDLSLMFIVMFLSLVLLLSFGKFIEIIFNYIFTVFFSKKDEETKYK